MMSITHSLIAAAGTSLVLGTADPSLLGLAVVGAQIPDIDTTTSTIGKIFYPISSWIEDRFPHRSITHSLLATATIAAVSMVVGHFWLGDWKGAIAFPLGHLLACFSDTFTKQGVQLFWPEPAWAVSVSNPRRRIKTGGAAELWVLVFATVLLMIGIWLANGGGITTKVTQSLGLRDGAITSYNQNASTNHIYAEITGVWASDRSDASGRYWIIDTAGNEFIVTDGRGIYKTGEQITISKLTTNIGQPSQTTVKTLSWDDEDPIPGLRQLAAQYPGAAIFVNGQVAVDFPEDVKPAAQLNQLQTVSVSASTVRFTYCPLTTAITKLTDQYAVGNLSVKIISPAAVGLWNG
ncbi:metal-dependent hydrolase [Moorena sp. SIO4G3]|uniref:metal-dependent hydrolase n=1 Tax=Moorena sp. SIO4G3 TaxID=2607821 RepID=UPI00142B541E|nr:metal-dependent hydrolase [Moorena sp. SIO4G3]NEO80704.1 metal-dependent hydrolase [Moorena sp. SIO4G3]